MKPNPIRNPSAIGDAAKPEADTRVDKKPGDQTDGPIDNIDNKVDFDQEVSARAYELYVARGSEEGHDLEDWLQAEMEIAAMKSRSAAA